MTIKYTHYSIISAQRTPTLAPLLDAHYPAEEFVAILTPQQENDPGYLALETIIKQRGIKTRRLRVASAYSTENIQEVLDQEFSELPENHRAILNATGGTKPLSTGAFLSCFNHDIPAYYINIHKLIWLINSAEPLKDVELSARINIKQLLAIHNVQEKDRQRQIPKGLPRNLDRLTDMWLKYAGEDDFMQSIGQLNYLASKAEKTCSSSLTGINMTKELEYRLAELEDDYQLIKTDGDKITFVSEEVRFFCNGGWLEFASYKYLQSLKAKHPELGIQDIACSLEVTMKNGNKQELDLVLLINNHLYVVECKTANLINQRQTGDSKAEDAIFKLAAIQKGLAGQATKGLILSYRKVRKQDKERAQTFDISIADAAQLSDLSNLFQKWIKSEAN